MEGTAKNILTGIGVVGGLFLLYKGYRMINPSGTTKADNQEATANTDFVKKNKTLLDKYIKLKKPTYADSYYAGWKAALYKAMDGAGTSVPVIKNIIGYMMSDTDVVKLIDAFGIMNRKTNNPFSSASTPLSLPAWFAEEMNDSDVYAINKILSDKKIGYRF